MKVFKSIVLATVIIASSTSLNAAVIEVPIFEGIASFNTQSHGGGYSSFNDEYWYSQWAGSTVHRYDSDYNFLGTFESGHSQMMQIWGETDGSYYSANWGYNTVTKIAGMNDSSKLWTYNLGATTGGVASDDNFVYAMAYNQDVVHKLDKDTGALVNTFDMGATIGSYLYGGLVVADDYLYRIDALRNVDRYNLTTGNLTSFNLGAGQQVYNLSFNGEQILFSANNSTSYVYSISTGSSVVPIPAAVWLFGSGLIGLVGVARRKSA